MARVAAERIRGQLVLRGGQQTVAEKSNARIETCQRQFAVGYEPHSQYRSYHCRSLGRAAPPSSSVPIGPVSLKYELVYHQPFATHTDAHTAIFDYKCKPTRSEVVAQFEN